MDVVIKRRDIANLSKFDDLVREYKELEITIGKLESVGIDLLYEKLAIIRQKILEELDYRKVVEPLHIEIETNDWRNHNNLTLAYYPPHETKSFDISAFKKDHPDLWEKYQKVGVVRADLSILGEWDAYWYEKESWRN